MAESDLSSEVTATTVLPAASNISTAQSNGDVDVTWTNNDDSPDGYIDVERSQDDFSTITEVATGLSSNTESYTDTTVSEGETYDYRIERNTDHATTTSNVATITTEIVVTESPVTTGSGSAAATTLGVARDVTTTTASGSISPVTPFKRAFESGDVDGVTTVLQEERGLLIPELTLTAGGSTLTETFASTGETGSVTVNGLSQTTVTGRALSNGSIVASYDITAIQTVTVKLISGSLTASGSITQTPESGGAVESTTTVGSETAHLDATGTAAASGSITRTQDLRVTSTGHAFAAGTVTGARDLLTADVGLALPHTAVTGTNSQVVRDTVLVLSAPTLSGLVEFEATSTGDASATGSATFTPDLQSISTASAYASGSTTAVREFHTRDVGNAYTTPSVTTRAVIPYIGGMGRTDGDLSPTIADGVSEAIEIGDATEATVQLTGASGVLLEGTDNAQAEAAGTTSTATGTSNTTTTATATDGGTTTAHSRTSTPAYSTATGALTAVHRDTLTGSTETSTAFGSPTQISSALTPITGGWGTAFDRGATQGTVASTTTTTGESTERGAITDSSTALSVEHAVATSSPALTGRVLSAVLEKSGITPSPVLTNDSTAVLDDTGSATDVLGVVTTFTVSLQDPIVYAVEAPITQAITSELAIGYASGSETARTTVETDGTTMRAGTTGTGIETTGLTGQYSHTLSPRGRACEGPTQLSSVQPDTVTRALAQAYISLAAASESEIAGTTVAGSLLSSLLSAINITGSTTTSDTGISVETLQTEKSTRVTQADTGRALAAPVSRGVTILSLGGTGLATDVITSSTAGGVIVLDEVIPGLLRISTTIPRNRWVGTHHRRAPDRDVAAETDRSVLLNIDRDVTVETDRSVLLNTERSLRLKTTGSE